MYSGQAPSGPLLILQEAWAAVCAAWSAIRTAWNRFVIRKKKPAPAVYAKAELAAAAGIAAGASVARRHGAPLAEQVRLLWDEFDRLSGQIRKVDEDSQSRHQAAMAGIERESDARRHLQAEVAAQRRRDERQTARVNARGLPLIGFGIVMTGIPDGLATWAWVGWLFTAAAGVLVTGFGLWPFSRWMAFRLGQRRREAKT